MVETIESKMNRVFRALFLQAVKDGSPEERQGFITRSRFNSACSAALHCKNVKRNTDGYWGTAQTMKLITIAPVNSLKNELQTYSRAMVREDIWAHDGYILEEGEQLRQVLGLAVKVESAGRSRRQNVGVMTAKEML